MLQKKFLDGYTSDKVRDFLTKYFCAIFIAVAPHVNGGYTYDFYRALATRQFLKKSHHLCNQKTAGVAAALEWFSRMSKVTSLLLITLVLP